MIALRKPAGMTVAEFQHWTPDRRADHRWHLVDGVPVCMAPAMTRANVWAYASIPSVEEILLLSSLQIEGEVWRRGAAPGWQEGSIFLGDGDEVERASIGFRASLREFYRTTSLL